MSIKLEHYEQFGKEVARYERANKFLNRIEAEIHYLKTSDENIECVICTKYLYNSTLIPIEFIDKEVAISYLEKQLEKARKIEKDSKEKIEQLQTILGIDYFSTTKSKDTLDWSDE